MKMTISIVSKSIRNNKKICNFYDKFMCDPC